ncbi:MAG: ROK family protein [Verrucomicrobia bacterium]|nr:ROK family protein [Kiritimatiellia bacterium]MCP5487398.1 ROK family protein [Verrucomicrobiota bacterium]
MKDIYIGFDLGGTKMMAVVYDQKFKLLGKKRKKTKGNEGAQAGVQRIISTLNEALADAKITPDQLKGIGCGIPGPLDLEKGIILEAPNLGWKNVRLKQMLSDEYHCPVTLLNDVDAGTFGEYRFGAGRGGRCVLGIFPGTGIGGGCVYHGQLIEGGNHSCMEIGHLNMDRNGRLCGCGKRGCLETSASRLAIAAEAAAAAYRGEAPILLELAGTDLAQIRSGVLAEAIARGDKVVEAIVRNAASRIGLAIGNVANLLAPDIAVLGGGMVEAMSSLFLEEVSKAIGQSAMKPFAKDLTVKVAELGDFAGAMGAAASIADLTQ